MLERGIRETHGGEIVSWMNPSGEGIQDEEYVTEEEFMKRVTDKQSDLSKYDFIDYRDIPYDLSPAERRINFTDDGDDEANGCQHRHAQNPRVG